METHGIAPDWVEADVLDVLDRAFGEARSKKVEFGATWAFSHLMGSATGGKILRDVPGLGTTESIRYRLSGFRFNTAEPGTLSHAWKKIVAAAEEQRERQNYPMGGTQFAGLILSCVGQNHHLYEALFQDSAPRPGNIVDKLLNCHLNSVTLVPTRRDVRRAKQAQSEEEAREHLICWLGPTEMAANGRKTMRFVWFGQPHRVTGHACDAVRVLYNSWFNGEDFLPTRRLNEAMGLEQGRNAANLLASRGLLSGIRSYMRFSDGQWSMIVPPESNL